MKKTGILCWLALAVLAFGGCATNPKTAQFQPLDLSNGVTITNKLTPDLLQPPTEPFVLGPGDKLDIEMQGNPDTRATATIGLDGKVYYSLLPGVDLGGLTLAD